MNWIVGIKFCIYVSPSVLHSRVQKERASRSEDAVERLNAQLMEKESAFIDCRAQLDEIRAEIKLIGKEKAQLEATRAHLLK